VGFSSTHDLKAILNSNQVAKCPITAANINYAEQIYGPSMPMLKGKTVRHAPQPVTPNYVAVPPEILSANQHIIISGDIFFINKFPFLTTISQTI